MIQENLTIGIYKYLLIIYLIKKLLKNLKGTYFLNKNWNIQSFYYTLKEFEMFNSVWIIFNHINQVINFKESKFVIFYGQVILYVKNKLFI